LGDHREGVRFLPDDEPGDLSRVGRHMVHTQVLISPVIDVLELLWVILLEHHQIGGFRFRNSTLDGLTLDLRDVCRCEYIFRKHALGMSVSITHWLRMWTRNTAIKLRLIFSLYVPMDFEKIKGKTRFSCSHMFVIL